MESLIRAIISAVFVGFVVLAVILFILAITAPSELFLRRLGKETPQSQTQYVTSTQTFIERERVIEQPPDTEGILQKVRELIGGREQPQQQPQQQLPPSPPPPPPPTNFTLVDMLADKNRFSPSRIETMQGNTVRITFKAIDKTYNIEIQAYGLKQQAKASESKIVEFQATTVGEFVYKCTICSVTVEGTLVVKAQE